MSDAYIPLPFVQRSTPLDTQKDSKMLGTKIGEFKVFDVEGNEHTILIYSFVGVVSLYTVDGKTVLRLGKGKYQVGSFPIVNLQSTDPQAP